MSVDTRPPTRVIRHRSFVAALLLGIGLMAAVDEIVFHQLLQWHHFFDRATPDIGLLSDGLLHAGELLALAAGVFLLLDAQRRGEFSPRIAVSGLLVGLGAFQLWDGIIDHKVLRVHQIRYDVDILPYDILWNATGAVLLLAGIAVGLTARRRGTAPREPR